MNTPHKSAPLPRFWNCGPYRLSLRRRPLIMGILNVTPDSFSDGGTFLNVRQAISRAREIEQEGADIIDIGGESTRPGAAFVPVKEELRRVLPVIAAVAKKIRIPISLDTRKSEVARQGLDCGASIINDVSGATYDPALFSVVAKSNAGLILMHSKGTPKTMQKSPRYKNLINEIYTFLERQMQIAVASGISKTRIVVDPGIGFGKTVHHNLTLLNHISDFRTLGVPVLIGPSRKSFIGKVLARPYLSVQGKSRASLPSALYRPSDTPLDRLEGTAAAVAIALSRGARILRVHDVAAMVKVARVAEAILSDA